MRALIRMLSLLVVALVCCARTASAQTPAVAPSDHHIATAAAMQDAVAAKVSSTDAKRQAILDVLHRRQVADTATRMGLDLKQADARVATLDGPRLDELAAAASRANADLAGGSTTVITISITTLLLIIILVVLLAK